MSKKVLDRLKAHFGARILETNSKCGDDEAVVGSSDWAEVARFLREDASCLFDQWVDITAVDYPLREPALPRFDLVCMVRSMKLGHRVRIKTRVAEGGSVPTLVDVWLGANWGEREVFDMFGITFDGHPDPRRILMYDEFVGHPLRKDYPVDRVQPLVAYRQVEGIEKLPPFGPDEGQPWSRTDWTEKLAHRDLQVSPAIGEQQQQRPALSKGIEYTDLDDAAVRDARD
jgi:NADH-quinone oxidoreductase subunit C